MMKKIVAILCMFMFLAATVGFMQTHTFPALDTNNTFTGTNTFNGPTVLNSSTSETVNLKFTETNAPICVSGFDFFWGDAVAHRMRQCANGGATGSVAMLSDTLGAFATGGAITPSSITTPGSIFLQTASGFLPATIANDTAGGIVVTNNAGKQVRLIDAAGNLYVGQGSGAGILFFGATSGNATVVASAVAGSSTLTLPSVTDTLAVLISAQAFSNKNMTSVGAANNITLITGGATNCGTQGPTASINGTGAPADIYTCTLLASQVALNKVLDVSCGGVHDVGTVSTALTMNLNGQNLLSGATGTTASQSFTLGVKLLNTGPTTGFGWGIAQNTGGTLTPFSITVTGLNWAANQTLNCRFSVAAGDHITGGIWVPQVLQ